MIQILKTHNTNAHIEKISDCQEHSHFADLFVLFPTNNQMYIYSYYKREGTNIKIILKLGTERIIYLVLHNEFEFIIT